MSQHPGSGLPGGATDGPQQELVADERVSAAGYSLDLTSATLHFGERAARLERQPARVLELLLREAGGVVSRRALQRHVWGDTHVDLEAGLNYCIREVRRALAEVSGRQDVVETLPRRGYRLRVALGEQEPVSAPRPDRRPQVSRAPARWAAVAAALTALALGGFATVRHLATGATSARRPTSAGSTTPAASTMSGAGGAVVVADFTNATDDDTLGGLLTQALRMSLGQSPALVIVPRSQLGSALARMRLPAASPISREVGLEICQREGAALLVSGGVVSVGDRYSLQVEAIDPRSDTAVSSMAAEDLSRDELLATLGRLAEGLRHELGESLSGIRRTTRPLEAVTTASLEALSAYSLAVQAVEVDDDWERAAGLLRVALDLDPEFSMAAARLGALSLFIDLDPPSAMALLDAALRHPDRLAPFDELYTRGWVATLPGRPEGKALWTLLRQRYPQRYEGFHNSGMWLLEYELSCAAAAPLFERARQLRRARLDQNVAAGYCLLLEGRVEELRRILAMPPGSEPNAELVLLLQLVDGLPAGAGSAGEAVDGRTPGNTAGAPCLSEYCTGAARALSIQRGDLQGALASLGDEADTAYRLRGAADRLARLAVRRELGPNSRWRAALAGELSALEAYLTTQIADTDTLCYTAALGVEASRGGEPELASRAHRLFRDHGRLAAGLPLVATQLATLEGELALAAGRSAEAVQRFTAARDRAETWPARYGLARALLAAGRSQEAVPHLTWVVANRGRAVTEPPFVIGLERRVLDWYAAHRALASLAEPPAPF
jgi:DNA-binding winged helix-turn-helix (wHTH) protein